MRPLLSTLILAIGCQQQAGVAPLDRVPADARAVIVMGKKSIDGIRGYAAPDQEAHDELSQYFLRVLGVDVSRVEELIVFASVVEPEPQAAVVLVLPGNASLTFPQTGSHAGVSLHRVSDHAIACVLPGAIVMGTQPAVEAAIDVAQHHAPALDRNSPLRKGVPDNADFALAVRLEQVSADPMLQTAVRTYGVKDAVAVIRGENVTLTLEGDPQKLPMARSAFLQARDVALAGMRVQKDQMVQGDDVIAGAASIASYHQLRRVFAHLEPRLADGRLIVDAKMPTTDAAMVIPAIGVAAAVAIPAFMKYIRKSKTTEAPMNVRRLADASVAYYEEHHTFPPSTDWTPAGGCCRFPGGKCPPQPGHWTGKTWPALAFTVEDPFYYQYRYTSERGHFVAEARGDLNCDGVFSNYKREGTVDTQGNVHVSGLAVVNDIE